MLEDEIPPYLQLSDTDQQVYWYKKLVIIPKEADLYRDAATTVLHRTYGV